ncbi:MAG: SDR family NAD(P)-dependent oxidoreductase [Pseudomonadales bacterium]|nr:SDR family NAD(P)-dependent oxidoreductase [Pseudomonadales bacterium]
MTEVSRKLLEGQVAIVSGATRGAGRGIARMLGAAGATVYCTGRSGGGHAATPGRIETIEETAELVTREGGKGIAVRVDHTEESEVVELVSQVKVDQGRIDILVNDIWGGDSLVEWGKRFWEIDVSRLRTLFDRAVFSHLLTSRHVAPLMIPQGKGLIIEITDGHTEGYRGQVIYDLIKISNIRLGYAMAHDLVRDGVTALSLTPGFLRSEAMLEIMGVTEENWRDAIEKDPFFAESETPCFVGRAVVGLATDPNVRSKAGLSFNATQLAREYGFSDIDGRNPDFWRLFTERMRERLDDPSPLEGMDHFNAWALYCQIHREPMSKDLASQLAARLGFTGAGQGVLPR